VSTGVKFLKNKQTVENRIEGLYKEGEGTVERKGEQTGCVGGGKLKVWS